MGKQEILYERVVKFNKPIGLDKYNANTPTNLMTVLTDKHGNLVTTFPGFMIK
ncbi:hypothetical protein l11_18050 [Neisseria weaveri LMG 5135]|nr:hypothetical protein l11_18050 [Neisseria weaveri LMG 5135]